MENKIKRKQSKENTENIVHCCSGSGSIALVYGTNNTRLQSEGKLIYLFNILR